jgi:hypothetical protein
MLPTKIAPISPIATGGDGPAPGAQVFGCLGEFDQAVPTAGLLRVQRNANRDRLLPRFRGTALEFPDGGQVAAEMFRADRRNAQYFAYRTGVLTGKGSLEPRPHPPPKPIVAGPFIGAVRRAHADAALSGVDRL